MYVKKPFSLSKRPRKKGPAVYYAQFRQRDGSWSTAKSTMQTSKADAETWCMNYLKVNGYTVGKSAPLFAEFSKNFFNYEGPWARDRRITGHRISPRNCEEKQRLLDKQIIPKIGALKLTQIDRPKIKELRDQLFYDMKFSGSTVNKALSCIKTILEDAEEKNLVQMVPKIDRVSARPEKTKGILTIEEVRRVLDPRLWDDHRAYVINLTAASTGMRQGELLGLRFKNFRGHYIEAAQSWDEHGNRLNETTKTGRARNVIIPEIVRDALQSLIDINPYTTEKGADTFIFFNRDHSHRPAEGAYMTKCLYRAMERIGIPEEERKGRNITFHSWRYFLNSLLINAKIPLTKIQSVTGHLTDEMSAHYYSMQIEDMQDVLKIQQGIFDVSEKPKQIPEPGSIN